MTPLMWAAAIYGALRRIVQLYAGIYIHIRDSPGNTHMIHYALLVYIQDNFFVPSALYSTRPRENEDAIGFTGRSFVHMLDPDTPSKTQMKQNKAVRSITAMFFQYSNRMNVRGFLETRAMFNLIETTRQMQDSAFNMTHNTVMDIEKFTDNTNNRNQMLQKKAFNEGFPIVGFGRITKYLRDNSVISSFRSKYDNMEQETKNNAIFSGLRIFRGNIATDQMSTCASSLPPEELEALLNADPDNQRGIVFLLLFNILINQLYDYQQEVIGFKSSIQGQYMVLMQVVISSIYHDEQVRDNPRSVLIQQYAMQLF